MKIMAGMRTTGQLHIGHYWGVLRNWVKLQDTGEYQCIFGAMDLHGMTTTYKDVSPIPNWNRDIIAEWLAWGIDPNKSIVYVQSQIPELLELFMYFSNLTPLGWLERVNTWKDAIEEAKQNDTHNLGRFAYPVLQAADIAIFRGQKVPVGQDQKGHLEISREIIRRFNSLYKVSGANKLPEPEALLTDTPALPGLDGRKMSKSYNNSLLLTEEEKTLQKKIKGMPTDPARVRREDPGEPEKCPVYAFHKLYSSDSDLEWVQVGCRTAGIGCGDCKMRLAENINKMSAEPREKKKELLNNPKTLDSIIRDGSEKARVEAQATLKIVRECMKLS